MNAGWLSSMLFAASGSIGTYHSNKILSFLLLVGVIVSGINLGMSMK